MLRIFLAKSKYKIFENRQNCKLIKPLWYFHPQKWIFFAMKSTILEFINYHPKNSPRMVQIIFRRPGPTSTWTALRWDLGILGKSIPEDHACAAAQDTEVQIYIIKLCI